MILTNECYQAAGDDKTTPSVEMVMKFMDLIDKERKELNAYYDAQDAKRQKQQEEEERRRQYHQINYDNDNNYHPSRANDNNYHPSRTITRNDPEHYLTNGLCPASTRSAATRSAAVLTMGVESVITIPTLCHESQNELESGPKFPRIPGHAVCSRAKLHA